ncbi:LuxR family transcriptional regulator [Jeongeupia naejangsanensis]|uniref:Helix-turn-helix transcriptional regulator n=1 Tax=Jeongeupia naejangsanensis TaxID=613195 RepID=A0ABS2BMI1_9NEIS|nr:helix-turn-helix transcriptional regulator [Jeongeupia naejangsanensis]MBM3116211.1 helix-turn-helix transcriptional regulator [Jeongeupia naejangsanensis]
MRLACAVPDRNQALTPREQCIQSLIIDGKSYKQIAALLGISVDTVRRHGSRIKQKNELASTRSLACIDLPGALIQQLLLALPSSTPLTPTERLVLGLACHGHSAKQIARLRNSSARTVEKHRQNAMAKLGVRSTRQLASLVRRQYAIGGT